VVATVVPNLNVDFSFHYDELLRTFASITSNAGWFGWYITQFFETTCVNFLYFSLLLEVDRCSSSSQGNILSVFPKAFKRLQNDQISSYIE
jgi:hypothetical protein